MLLDQSEIQELTKLKKKKRLSQLHHIRNKIRNDKAESQQFKKKNFNYFIFSHSILIF